MKGSQEVHPDRKEVRAPALGGKTVPAEMFPAKAPTIPAVTAESTTRELSLNRQATPAPIPAPVIAAANFPNWIEQSAPRPADQVPDLLDDGADDQCGEKPIGHSAEALDKNPV